MSRQNETDLLAPFEIWEVPLDGAILKFKKPLVLTPSRVPDDPEEPSEPGENEYLQVIYPDLHIDVFAENREELWDAVHSTIHFAWKHYVRPDDSELDSKTRVIKRNYLDMAEEVVDG